ncbi:MAG: copper-binding protein [Chloracidobacterium sp.]|nr:copper-binding protein [Chloracidobacterium sp.]
MSLFGCQKAEVGQPTPPPHVPPVKNLDASPMPPASPNAGIPKDGKYDAKGVVTKINLKLGSIEIDHEDIPGMMPPMRMEFYVQDKRMLDGLAVGDKVDFVLEYKHPTETIATIKKAK